MKRLTPIIMLLAFVLLGCGSIKPEETENYQYGYDVGYDKGYQTGYDKGYDDAQSVSGDYVKNNYSIDEVYESSEILDYVKGTYDIFDIYSEDDIFDALYENGYIIDDSNDINTSSTEAKKYTYVGNKNTKKFHYSYCSSVSDMKESNKVFNNSRFYFTNRDYEPCKICKP